LRGRLFRDPSGGIAGVDGPADRLPEWVSREAGAFARAEDENVEGMANFVEGGKSRPGSIFGYRDGPEESALRIAPDSEFSRLPSRKSTENVDFREGAVVVNFVDHFDGVLDPLE
jgi:hypothetical protein